MSEPTTSQTTQLRMGMSLPIAALFPGDIIATMSGTKSSEAIQWATNAPFSHAILCLKLGLAVDATPGKGVAKEIMEKKLKGVTKAAVFRHRTASQDQCDLAANWASAQAGKPYDNVGAARVGLTQGSRTRPLQYTPPGRLINVGDEVYGEIVEGGHDRSFFCSELIYRAFAVAGIPIIDTPARTTGPGQLLATTGLVYMGHLQDLG